MQLKIYRLGLSAASIVYIKSSVGKNPLLQRRVSLSKPIVFLLLAIVSLTSLKAQEKDNYIFRDSSVMEPVDSPVSAADSVSKMRDEENNNDTNNTKVFADTVLVSNELVISADSIRILKTTRPFAYAKNLDSILKSLKTQEEVKYSVEPNPPSGIDRFFSSGITQAVFWSVAVGMLLFILFKLFFSGGFLQRRSATNKVKVIAEEEEHVPDVNEYGRLIKQAVAARDYRLATRFLYLQSLHYLIDRGVVTYAADKTNFEYLSEMSGNTKRNDFAALTLKYEYVWYGGFTVDETAFAGIQQLFTQFNNAL